MTDASKYFTLSPAEWLVVFPRAPNAVSDLPDSLLPPSPKKDEEHVESSGGASDPATKLRQEYPIDSMSLDRTLTVLDASGLQFQIRLTRWLKPLVAHKNLFPPLLGTIFCLNIFLIVVIIAALNDGQFGIKQLVGGSLGAGLMALAFAYSVVVVTVVARRMELSLEMVMSLPLEQLIRWQQLGSGDLKSHCFGDMVSEGCDKDREDTTIAAKKEEHDLSSPLLQHVSNDRLCPCRQCLKNLPRSIFWERMFRSSVMHIYGTCSTFMIGWTAIVYYHATLWSLPWGIFVGAQVIAVNVFYNFISWIDKWWQPSFPLVSLTTRIYYRASSLAFKSFLERARRDLQTPPSIAPDDVPEGPELFVRLHAGYMASWGNTHLGKDTFTRLVATLLQGSCVLATIINMAVGSCVTFWSVNYILASIVFYSLSFISVPIANSQISTITALYGDAERALLSILAEASLRLPFTFERQRVHDRLMAHALMLQTFKEANGVRAKVLGIPVTWGLVKTFFVTLFTLGVGLWSVLKGAGLTFTLQSVCPGV